ncbi:MAG: DNA polymerase, partial [Verrucomicrobiota bacterium]
MHLATASSGEPRCQQTAPLRPFAWLREGAGEALKGAGAFPVLHHFEETGDYLDFLKDTGRNEAEAVKPLEHQYLLQSKSRLFDGMHFSQLRRCQLDIETASSVEGGFSNPRLKEDRVLAIGLRTDGENRYLVLEDRSDAAERTLLKQLNDTVAELDPD